MAQPPTIYKPGKLNYLWNYLGSSLKSFAAALSPYISSGSDYKKYVALLTQTGANPPVITELENTLGVSPTSTYNFTGNYSLVFTGLTFDWNKTAVFISNSSNNNFGIAWTEPSGSNTLVVLTREPYPPGYPPLDDYLSLTTLEIRVYP
jgi:hypothetical protein